MIDSTLDPVLMASGAGPPLLVAGILVLRHAPRDRPFGVANAVTAIRLLIACSLAGLAAATMAQPLPHEIAWIAAGLAMTGLALDGLDGFLARRLGSSSRFGARFDMEVDAFQILVLSILATTMGKAGAWIIAAGLARYAFVAAGMIWPLIATPLPPSFRRKVVAVVQGFALAALASPALTPPFSTAIAGLTLVLLLWSFAIDIAWTLTAPTSAANT